MDVSAFLAEHAARFGFSYGLQETAGVAARLAAGEEPGAIAQLTEGELGLESRLRVEKRKVEWLAGRMAAKAAFARHPGARPGQVSVLSGPSRAPYLHDLPGWWVSISHSHAYAVAVVAEFAIGVDLEKIEPRPAALADWFFSPEERLMAERERLLPGQGDERITWLWSRKEAVSKYLRLGGSLDFRRIQAIPDCVLAGEDPAHAVRLLSGVCDGYCVSLALPGDGAPHDGLGRS